MRGLVAASAACLLALATAPPAHAQVSARVLGGMTRAAGSEPFVAGSLGVRAGFIEVEGEVGRLYLLLFTDFGLESGLTIDRPDVNVVYGALGFRF